MLKNPAEIANAFNNYFTQIGPTLDSQIRPAPHDFKYFLCNPNSSSLFLNPTSPYEVSQIVKSFKDGTAGLDHISPRVVKSVILHLCDPLSHIFNLSLSKGVFPSKLKLARVTPIHKKGDPSEIDNYRPISVLPVFSKLLEKIVYERTIKFLDKFEILFHGQYGFRQKHSTSMALLDLTNKIINGVENNLYTMGIFIDLSKAFDIISHVFEVLRMIGSAAIYLVVFNVLNT